MERIKDKLFTILPSQTKLLRKNSSHLNELINQEKLTEAKSKVDKYHEFAYSQIKKFEKKIEDINFNNKFIKSNLLNDNFERFWPDIKNTIETQYSTFNIEYEKKIKEKEEHIKNREEIARNQKDITEVKSLIDEASAKLDLYLYETFNFFPKNFFDHDKTNSFLNQILKYIDDTESLVKKKITELLSIIKFNDFKQELERINSSWLNKSETMRSSLDKYQGIIKKREELRKYINEKISIFQSFIEDRNKQISDLIEENLSLIHI